MDLEREKEKLRRGHILFIEPEVDLYASMNLGRRIKESSGAKK